MPSCPFLAGRVEVMQITRWYFDNERRKPDTFFYELNGKYEYCGSAYETTVPVNGSWSRSQVVIDSNSITNGAASGRFDVWTTLVAIAGLAWATLTSYTLWPPISAMLPRIETDHGWVIHWKAFLPIRVESALSVRAQSAAGFESVKYPHSALSLAPSALSLYHSSGEDRNNMGSRALSRRGSLFPAPSRATSARGAAFENIGRLVAPLHAARSMQASALLTGTILPERTDHSAAASRQPSMLQIMRSGELRPGCSTTLEQALNAEVVKRAPADDKEEEMPVPLSRRDVMRELEVLTGAGVVTLGHALASRLNLAVRSDSFDSEGKGSGCLRESESEASYSDSSRKGHHDAGNKTEAGRPLRDAPISPFQEPGMQPCEDFSDDSDKFSISFQLFARGAVGEPGSEPQETLSLPFALPGSHQAPQHANLQHAAVDGTYDEISALSLAPVQGRQCQCQAADPPVHFVAEDDDLFEESSLHLAHLKPIYEDEEEQYVDDISGSPSEASNLSLSFAVPEPKPVLPSSVPVPVAVLPLSPQGTPRAERARGVTFQIATGAMHSSHEEPRPSPDGMPSGAPSSSWPRHQVVFALAPGEASDDEERPCSPALDGGGSVQQPRGGSVPHVAVESDIYGQLGDSFTIAGEGEGPEEEHKSLSPFAATDIQGLGTKWTSSELSENSSPGRLSPRDPNHSSGTTAAVAVPGGAQSTHQSFFFAPFAADYQDDLGHMPSLPTIEETEPATMALEPVPHKQKINQSAVETFVRPPQGGQAFHSPFAPISPAQTELKQPDINLNIASPGGKSPDAPKGVPLKSALSHRAQSGFYSPFQATNLTGMDLRWTPVHSEKSTPMDTSPTHSVRLHSTRSAQGKVHSRAALRSKQASCYLLDIAFTGDLGSNSRSQSNLSIEVPVVPASIFEYAISKTPSFEEVHSPPHSIMFIFITCVIEIGLAGIGIAGHFFSPW